MKILLYLIILFGCVYRDVAISLNDIRRKFSQLESKVSTLESSNTFLVYNIQIQKSVIENLTATMKLHEVTNLNLISSNKNLTSRITSNEATNLNLLSSNKNLISSNKNLISSNKNLISSDMNLVASNLTLSREINSLKSHISNITAWICTLGVDAQLNRKYCKYQLVPPMRDCLELYQAGIKKNGIYNVTMGGLKIIEVYCDQKTDGGGWTVIQRRVNGAVDFYQNWAVYKQGFGDNRNEFYIGNDNINTLSILGKTKGSELRVDMEDFEGNKAYAKYGSFKVDNESAKYRLHVTGYTGDAGDSLAFHNGARFSTIDQDNDGYSCANKYHSGWWYNNCFTSNLNGEYVAYKQPQPGDNRGILWRDWKGYSYSLKFVEMKVRRNV